MHGFWTTFDFRLSTFDFRLSTLLILAYLIFQCLVNTMCSGWLFYLRVAGEKMNGDIIALQQGVLQFHRLVNELFCKKGWIMQLSSVNCHLSTVLCQTLQVSVKGFSCSFVHAGYSGKLGEGGFTKVFHSAEMLHHRFAAGGTDTGHIPEF